MPMQENPPGTGYRVTFADFVALLSKPGWRESIIPLVEKWFNCTVVQNGDQPQLRSVTGELLSLQTVHDAIQQDKQRQYDLYQAAMNLWR